MKYSIHSFCFKTETINNLILSIIKIFIDTLYKSMIITQTTFLLVITLIVPTGILLI